MDSPMDYVFYWKENYHFEYDLTFTSHELLKLAESDELPKWNDYSNPDR